MVEQVLTLVAKTIWVPTGIPKTNGLCYGPGAGKWGYYNRQCLLCDSTGTSKKLKLVQIFTAYYSSHIFDF